MVGFGGGSSYIALLILFQTSYLTAPSIALVCNMIVVAGGTFHFWRNKHLDAKFFLPFILFSVPCSYIGGSIPIGKNTFQLILGVSLCGAGLRMIFFRPQEFLPTHPRFIYAALIGGALGLLSGLVGIGGGIFLAPILYTLRWGTPKKIAATASTFILFNSFFGLLGQMQKVGDGNFVLKYWPLFAAVFLGGQVGNWACNTRLSGRVMEVLTAVLVLFVSVRLIYNVTGSHSLMRF